jgi:hypothetical protein
MTWSLCTKTQNMDTILVTFFYFENYDQVETVLFLLHSFDALRRFKSHFGPREVWIKVGGFVIRLGFTRISRGWIGTK